MLSLIELKFLVAGFLSLRWLSRQLKSHAQGTQHKTVYAKALIPLVYMLPFPASGQRHGLWRFVKPLLWTPVQLLVLLVLYVAYCLARIQY